MTDDLVRPLVWDSAFFGRRIARLAAERLDAAAVAACRAQGRDGAIDCLYFLARGDDVDSRRNAEDLGFRMMDVRVTLENDRGVALDTALPGTTLRPATAKDVAELRRIAATAFTATRFFADRNFARDRCRELYARWIEQDVCGTADCVLVGDDGDGPAGFVSCHRHGVAAKIGLLAVARSGRGLGRTLIRGALAWARDTGLATTTVVTQGANVPALRAYQREGFVTSEVDVWYHWWPGLDAPRHGETP